MLPVNTLTIALHEVQAKRLGLRVGLRQRPARRTVAGLDHGIPSIEQRLGLVSQRPRRPVDVRTLGIAVEIHHQPAVPG